MSNQTLQSIYQPLQLAFNDIRLIKLLPLNPQEPSTTVKCEIFKASLDDLPHYECLSYTWGNMRCTQPISVNAIPMSVGYNLFGALMDLRTAEPRTLWIDAICIDQSNFPERNHQVQRMRQIYENATGVLVWLGPFDAKISKVEGIPFLEWVQKECEKQNTLYKEHSDNPKDNPKKQAMYAHLRSLRRWKSVQDNLQGILAKPWWSRIWIIQEVVCAKVVTVHLGLSFVTWEALHWICCYVPTESKMRSWHELEQQRRAKSHGRNSSLFDLTYDFQASEATDPRDKVFALVGLANSSQKEGTSRTECGFRIDYNLPLRSVLANLICHQIEVTRSLDVLLAAQGKRYRGSSWIPDPAKWLLGTAYPSLGVRDPRLIDFKKLFKGKDHNSISASGSSIAASSFRYGDTLTLQGFVLETSGRTQKFKDNFSEDEIVCLLAGAFYPAILVTQGESYVFKCFYTISQEELSRKKNDMLEQGRRNQEIVPFLRPGRRNISEEMHDIMTGVYWNEYIETGKEMQRFRIV